MYIKISTFLNHRIVKEPEREAMPTITKTFRNKPIVMFKIPKIISAIPSRAKYLLSLKLKFFEKKLNSEVYKLRLSTAIMNTSTTDNKVMELYAKVTVAIIDSKSLTK